MESNIHFEEEEFDCPLCFKLLAEPIAVPCAHNFCKLCLQRSLQEHKPECPVCRSDLSFLNANDLRSNVLLQHVIQKVFGKTYETRLEEAEQERRELEKITRQVVKLYIGNRHRLENRTSGETWHKWTLFVRMDEDIDESDYIESVTVYLHPTFTPSTIVLREPPYEVSRLGWGVFNIKLKIRFLSKFNKQPLEVSHFLSFTGNGDFNSEDVEFVTRKYDAQAESDQDMSLEGQ